MAAKLKPKDSIVELYSTLSSLYDELVEKYEACIRQRRKVESNVQQCRKLLKPWPCFDKNNEEDVAKEVLDKHENPSNENDERQGDVGVEEQEKTKSNPDIELLDKILAKAQRAREIQEKIDAAGTKAKLPRKSHSTQDPTTSKGKVMSKQTAKKEKATNIGNRQQRNPKTVAMVTRSTPTSQPSSTQPVVKQPVLERKNKPVPMKTTYGASFGKHTQSRPVTAAGKKCAKDYLDGVLTDTSGKPRITKDKTQHKSEKQASHLPLKKGVKKPTDTQNIEEKQQSSSKDHLDQEEAENHGGEGHQDTAEDGDFVQRAKNELMRISTELKEISFKKQERMKKEEMIETTEEKATCEPTTAVEPGPVLVQRKPFLLVEDGHSLSLPTKYRKMKSLNSKLVTQIHKKLHETDFNLSDGFTSSLENHFHWPNKSNQSDQFNQSNQLDQSNQLSHDALTAEAEALMKSQRKLLLHANWVIDRSVVIGTSSSAFSWQNVYKCYRHWQMLLGKFREVQKRTQDLMTAEGYLQRHCPCGGCLAARELTTHYSSTLGTNQHDLSTQRCCLFATSLMADREETRGLHDHVTYSSDKELRRMNEALHDLETREINVQIQRRIGSTALQALEQLDPSDRLFIPIYRGLWGLVCGQGKAFPSLVLDSTED